ncbi:hypothetical protein MSIMFI_04969 [Mycobacterium simulans]|nr:hypothetical protein MSIMFI_04969 [Mycobacterium simulans]
MTHGITATPTVSVLGLNGSAGNRTRGVVGPDLDRDGGSGHCGTALASNATTVRPYLSQCLDML